MSREWVFVTIDSGKTTQDGEKRFFHDGNNLKTPVSSSLTRVSAIVTSDYVDGSMKLTCFRKRKRIKKWYDSAGTVATETRVNVMYPLTETCDCRHVSATVLRVYVKFPFTDSRNFVLCF